MEETLHPAVCGTLGGAMLVQIVCMRRLCHLLSHRQHNPQHVSGRSHMVTCAMWEPWRSVMVTPWCLCMVCTTKQLLSVQRLSPRTSRT